MTRTIPANRPPAPQPSPEVVRITHDLVPAAARRLVQQQGQEIDEAARRLVASAPIHGIDLTFAWGTLGHDAKGVPHVRQVCMGVPGSGRTAMLFLSEPMPGGDPGGVSAARTERIACIDALCAHLGQERPNRVRLAQSLPEPGEAWAIQALTDAGFVKVGDLAYLRKPAGTASTEVPAWPEGVRVVRLDQIEGDREAVLIGALERTYIDTLDCPELCGLREVRDVLASHKATGTFDPSLWWVVYSGTQPEGCALMSRCPEQRSIELVYLGLGPALRGRRLARPLLSFAIGHAARGTTLWPVTCAVDARNAPALRLYQGLGFARFASRVALVRPITPR
ncbi:MAG: GNAT family N-acetyltransferase [Phycisphaerales bacterium]|nr:GNAT family N-acetyltransferase [Phycisphaerales bacterium]